MKEVLSNYRCSCGKMLLRGFIFLGEIEVKCRFCKRMNVVSGMNGNMSSDHRYMFITEMDGVINHTTASVKDHLGFTSKELAGVHAHTLLGFEEGFYKTITKKLENKPDGAYLFQTIQCGKGKPALIQVGVRVFDSSLGKKHFLFDVETNPIRKSLPMAPIGQVSKLKKVTA